MDHLPLTVLLKEAARPLVATSFLTLILLTEGGQKEHEREGGQENFAPGKVFGLRYMTVALFFVTYIEMMSNKQSR